MAEPTIFIHKFWTEYKPETVTKTVDGVNGKKKEIVEPTGKLREVDWVAYSPIGSLQKTMNTEAISRLSCVQPLSGKAAHNPAVMMAHARWNAIKPAYDAWKAGREVPLDGTPLAAWNGVSSEQAELFRMKGVRTVEAVAGLTDTHRQTMGIPGLHDIIENAKRFMTAQDKSAVTTALAQKDAEIAQLRAQMEELIEMVKEAKADDAAEPKRRGRPPKQAEAVAAA